MNFAEKSRGKIDATTYYDAARVFAKAASKAIEEDTTGALSVAAQNAYKAIEFALTGLALSRGRRLLDHSQTVQFARDLKLRTTDRIVEALTLYSRAYALDVATQDATRVMNHMRFVLQEVGELAGYDFDV